MHTKNQLVGQTKTGQRGAALITSLIILLAITLISVAAVRSSRLELRMANNAEVKHASFQNAQAIIDAVFDTPDNVPIVGGVGFKICTAGEAGCDLNTIAFDGGLFAGDLASLDLGVVVERVGTEHMPLPRGMETSADKFSGAVYSIQARYDRADEGLGRSDVVEGMFVLVPK